MRCRLYGVSLVFAGILAQIFLPTVAKGWQCARVPDDTGFQSGPALFWSSRQLSYAINQNGSVQLPMGTITTEVAQAFATWQNVALRFGQDPQCTAIAVAGVPQTTDIAFTALPNTSQSYVGFNYIDPNSNLNVIVFRDDNWPYALAGASADLMALTTTTFNTITGEIRDADIEINTHDFIFTTGDQNVAYDLQSTLVHEVGHFLGFGHSTDTNASMFPDSNYGESDKRKLSCDDATIMWYRYPANKPTNSCAKNAAVNALCGFCAAPGVVYEEPTIGVTRSYDGLGGCNCHTSSQSRWALMPLGVLVYRRLRRRRIAAS